MAQIKGILLFHSAFQAKASKDAAGNPTGDPKFSASVLIAPNDPQLSAIQAEVNAASANTFPNGLPRNADLCFGRYEEFFQGKDYYNPKFLGYYVFKCTAKADDRPAVVNSALQPLLDPAALFPGAVVWLSAGISGYVKGTGGVGGWLNGIMVTDEAPPFGRLDNKPSVEQMFANLPQSHQQHLAAGQMPAPHVAANGAVITQPAGLSAPQPGMSAPAPVPPVAPPPAPAAPSAPVLLMTAKANGLTADDFRRSNPAWTDELLIQEGYAVRSSFV